ncbi:MAG TPA: TonB-dependent receptor, partial [Polyangiaceae bacterium]|nr:TonB-dependent receptor [Polyangiaceae bacterium]
GLGCLAVVPSAFADDVVAPEGPDRAPPPPPKATQDDGSLTAIVTPPVAIETPVPDVETPRSVEVILELTIDREGHVTRAAAVSGPEPHASASVSAAYSFRFEPARQGDRVVPARIHFLVRFEPVEPGPSEPAPNGTSAPAAPAERPQAVVTTHNVEEVVVVGQLAEDPGSRRMSRAETRNLAGAFDDPLRSVEVMPGVTPMATGLPLFFVRGAPPGNVGYFVDGVRIPLLYHAFLGPSVVHPAFLEQVTLNAGPAPVRFGRYAGAVVEATMARPSDHFRAEANIRLIDAGAFVQTPFANGKGYAMLSGRYSYTGLLLTLLSNDQRVDYWDYQGLVGYRLGKRDELSVFTFGAFDFGGSTQTAGGTEFHRIDVRWDHEFSARSKMRWAVTTGRDQTQSTQGFVSDNALMSRLSFENKHDDIVVRSGADVTFDDYGMEIDPAVAEPEIYLDLFPPRVDAAGGVYTDLVFFPNGPVQVIPGVRADVYSSLGNTAIGVDPRISASYRITPRLKATHGLALAHQTPNFVPQIPGAAVAGLEGGLQESLQASSNFEMSLPWEITASVGGFINMTNNLSDPVGLTQSLAIDETSKNLRALGRAAGIEVYIKRPLTRRLGGMLSYTFSGSSRSFDNITTVPGYDRPHVLNLALTYDIWDSWRLSGKLAFMSGVPGRRTTVDGFVFDQSRSDPFLRLDLKLSKRWYSSETFYWTTYLEVLNATYSGQVSSRTCTVDGCTDKGTAPLLLPSLGVEMGWN